MEAWKWVLEWMKRPQSSVREFNRFKPTTAFMTGKLKIQGDLSLAMKLEKLFTSLKSKL